MDDHILKHIINEEQNESYRISVIFKENSLILTVIQESNAWEANVPQQNLNKLAAQHEIDYDHYYSTLREYFTNTPPNIIFKLTKNNFVMYCVTENNINIKYFTCGLKKINYNECAENLFDKFYSQNKELQERLCNVIKQKDDLERGKNDYEKQLKEFIDRKKTDDDELYSSFVLVLNEKKKRIQHLNELLQAFRNGRPTRNPPPPVKRKGKNVKQPEQVKPKQETVSESESDAEMSDSYNTDEEKEKLPNDDDDDDDYNKNSIYNEPSTSKETFDFLLDDSPPRHNLPKRIKLETTAENQTVNILPMAKKEDEKVEENLEKYERNKDKSPVVDFSTQDLLDNI